MTPESLDQNRLVPDFGAEPVSRTGPDKEYQGQGLVPMKLKILCPAWTRTEKIPEILDQL